MPNEDEGPDRNGKSESWTPELPVDPAEYLGYGEPTYGGKPMPDFLPTREEYMWRFHIGLGIKSLPCHDPPGA